MNPLLMRSFRIYPITLQPSPLPIAFLRSPSQTASSSLTRVKSQVKVITKNYTFNILSTEVILINKKSRQTETNPSNLKMQNPRQLSLTDGDSLILVSLYNLSIEDLQVFISKLSQLGVMCDQHYGHALLIHLGKDLHNICGCLFINRSSWLIR